MLGHSWWWFFDFLCHSFGLWLLKAHFRLSKRFSSLVNDWCWLELVGLVRNSWLGLLGRFLPNAFRMFGQLEPLAQVLWGFLMVAFSECFFRLLGGNTLPSINNKTSAMMLNNRNILWIESSQIYSVCCWLDSRKIPVYYSGFRLNGSIVTTILPPLSLCLYTHVSPHVSLRVSRWSSSALYLPLTALLHHQW